MRLKHNGVSRQYGITNYQVTRPGGCQGEDAIEQTDRHGYGNTKTRNEMIYFAHDDVTETLNFLEKMKAAHQEDVKKYEQLKKNDAQASRTLQQIYDFCQRYLLEHKPRPGPSRLCHDHSATSSAQAEGDYGTITSKTGLLSSSARNPASN